MPWYLNPGQGFVCGNEDCEFFTIGPRLRTQYRFLSWPTLTSARAKLGQMSIEIACIKIKNKNGVVNNSFNLKLHTTTAKLFLSL